MRDTAFKRTLTNASLGTEFVLDGPFGSFFLHENSKRPAVCIAGGIGITPFRSMIVDAAHRKLPHTITLFYSNRRPEDAAFLEELTALSKENTALTLIPHFTKEKGRLTAVNILEHVDLSELPIFYIAGPTQMVNSTRGLLSGIGISPDDIKFEEFAGY